MKRLILTRHAKAGWPDLDQPDHDRPLSTSGQESTTKIGHWIASNGLGYGETISSSAQRCVETWHGIEAVVQSGLTPRFERKLYLAPISLMLEVLKSATDDTVLMLGHNPGIAGFAQELLVEPPKGYNFWDYPPAATSVIDFEIDAWSELSLRSGSLYSFVIPRELG